MNPQTLIRTAIIPAFEDLASLKIPDTFEARRQVLAIAFQETRLLHRRQVTASGHENGPAMSFWQFEKTGGCAEVFHNSSTRERMRRICTAYEVDDNAAALWHAMQYQDIVAAAAARLLLFTLPAKLPTTEEEGWKQYIAAWRPGKPHPQVWAKNWLAAETAVKEYQK